jgi:plastocyanin
MRIHGSTALARACLLALATLVPRAGHAQGVADPRTRIPDTVVVAIQKFKYQRGKVTVNAGDVVVWRNLDVVAHTLTADSGGFESPLIEPGEQ